MEIRNLAEDIFANEAMTPTVAQDLRSIFKNEVKKAVRKEVKKLDGKNGKKKKDKGKKSKSDKKLMKQYKHLMRDMAHTPESVPESELTKMAKRAAHVSIESGLPLLYRSLFDSNHRSKGGGRND